jgi:hypothetical protein
VSLTGNIQTMPLPDVLQFLGLGRKSGVLDVESGSHRKQVVFEDGLIVFCTAGSPKEYLGQHLLARTSLDEADVAEAFRVQAERGCPLGEVLVAMGKISTGEVETVLSRKIEDSLYDLFTWKSGHFIFDERPAPRELVPVRLALGWQDVVLEGARRADEMQRIAEVIPGQHVRLLVDRTKFSPGFPKSGGDKKLVELLEQGLSVGDVCPRFHASDFDILNRLSHLVRHGILAVDPASLTQARRSPAQTVRDGLILAQAGHVGEALGLLRDGLRELPEDRTLAEALRAVEAKLRAEFTASGTDLDAVPRLARPVEELDGTRLTSKQGFVLSRINGTWNVRSIAQICPFDELEVLAILDGLVRERMVTLETPVRPRR